MINLNRLLSKIEDIDQKTYLYSLQLLNKGLIISVPNELFDLNNRSLNLEYKFHKKRIFCRIASIKSNKTNDF